MAPTNIWNKFCLLRKEIIISLLLILTSYVASAQRYTTINLPNSDNQKLHYGFVIGLHVSKFKVKYSQKFVNQDSLLAINPTNNPGFALGFLVNKKIGDFFDLRLVPTAGFYANNLNFVFTNGESKTQKDVTYAEIPVLVKYKSERRKNFRMYLIGGVKPSFEVTNKSNEEGDEQLIIEKINLSVEYGVGMDIYYPMFKFSPELRISHGLNNMSSPSANYYNSMIEKLSTHSVTLYLIFGS